ncbi:MAG: hypothetical protein N2746_12430 [Deltaproteobacteria bacterium]|nr:hypothetical protein [Deltaproteobacteria bacterium]
MKNEDGDMDVIDHILHEIKSSLSNITGYTKLLLSNVAGEINHEQRDYLVRIRRNSYRITLYIDDVADAARLLHLQKELSLAPVVLHDVFKSVIERNEVILNDFKSSFYIKVVEEKSQIMSDPERLNRTMDVLISNLTKDINKRKILLATRRRDSTIEIIIAHAAEFTGNVDTFLQRFERVGENHLLQHAATSVVVVRAIGGTLSMYVSNISERMFIISFPLLPGI